MIEFDTNRYLHKYELDLIARNGWAFVINGLDVSQSSPAAMSVDVASGNCFIEDTQVSYAGGTVTIPPADATQNRIDLIVIDKFSNISVIQGQLGAGTDIYPNGALFAGSFNPDQYCVLAAVFVQAGATQITNTEIRDLRVINKVYENAIGGGTSGQDIHPFMLLGG